MNVDKKNTIMKILSLFQNFQISPYLTKNKFLKIEKGKNYKSPAGFKLTTNRFVVNTLTHCTTLLGNSFVREKINNIIFDFIVYFDRKFFPICPIPP